MEPTARRCYTENISLADEEFVEMMLMDGCFIILNLLIAHKTLDFEHSPVELMHQLMHDLILLENQLPFFVVSKIYDLVKINEDPPLTDLVHSLYDQISPINSKELRSVKRIDAVHPDPGLHFLHLYHLFLSSTKGHRSRVPSTSETGCTGCQTSATRLLSNVRDRLYRLSNFSDRLSSNFSTDSSHEEKSKFTTKFTTKFTIGNATFLEEAGIRFRKKKQVTDSIMDAEFTNGVMEITPLFINVSTVSQFRNLIALEKSHRFPTHHVIAFARFMDYIISTSKDVALLRKKGIIQHAFGSDKEVAAIFNRLTSGTHEYETPKLTKMYKDVNEYCNSKRHQWRAILMRDYFGSPWAAISLVAAVILISLTFLQTYFSMYSYFRPSSAN